MAQQAKRLQPCEVIEGQLEEAPVAAPVNALEASIAASAATPLDLPVEVFKSALERRKANRIVLMEWIRSALVEKIDYGRIHNVGKTRCQYAAQWRAHECPDPQHWSKPSLFKPGAEKICGMLGVTAHFPTLHDYEQTVLHGHELKQIIIRCELHDAHGRVVADGVGARSLGQDDGNLNKALKMAEKSAHIDATLRMAGLSEVFTQDLEDLRVSDPGQPQTSAKSAGQIEPRQGDKSQQPIGNQSDEHKLLENRLRGLKLDRERVKAWMLRKWAVAHFQDLTLAQYAHLMKKLLHFADQARGETKQEAADPEREAIQAEAQQAATEQASRSPADQQKVDDLLTQALHIRQQAAYADGQMYYRDIKQAQALEAEARAILKQS